MNRFLLFVFDSYYPSGGWNDFAGSFETENDALAHALTLHRDHFQVIDTDTVKIIRQSNYLQ